MAACDWLPIDRVGAVVDADDADADDPSLTAAVLDFMLESVGVTRYSPPPYDLQA
jgi:hypothetical protein